MEEKKTCAKKVLATVERSLVEEVCISGQTR